MEEILIQNSRTYAAQHQLCLAERLGFGIHGIVFVAENNTKAGKTAVKVHRAVEPFQRECAVYERLRDAGLSRLCDVGSVHIYRQGKNEDESVGLAGERERFI